MNTEELKQITPNKIKKYIYYSSVFPVFQGKTQSNKKMNELIKSL